MTVCKNFTVRGKDLAQWVALSMPSFLILNKSVCVQINEKHRDSFTSMNSSDVFTLHTTRYKKLRYKKGTRETIY